MISSAHDYIREAFGSSVLPAVGRKTIKILKLYAREFMANTRRAPELGLLQQRVISTRCSRADHLGQSRRSMLRSALLERLSRALA